MTRQSSRDPRLDLEADCTLTRTLRNRFGLTPTEAVVGLALADGLTYQEIADRFGISYHTVHSHVKAIHDKTGVSSNIRFLALIRRERVG